MTSWRWPAAALALLTACTAPLRGNPIPNSTPRPTVIASSTVAPRLLTPSATSTLTTRHTSTPLPTASPTPCVSPVETPAPCAEGLLWVAPPPRPLPLPRGAPEPARVPNAVRSFWVVDQATTGRRQITARLRTQTDHAAMWVEEGVWHDVGRLEKAAELFDTHIYPRTRAAFGSEWTPGIDQDPHIHILHATGLGSGVLGYTSGLDAYPTDTCPMSNQAEMITVNLDEVRAGTLVYNAVLARQLQRLIQWHQDGNEERWVKEGLAELAAGLNGFEALALRQAYLDQTDTSLIAWSGHDGQRGAAYLFAAYFHQRFGDEGTQILTSEPADGIAGIDAALESLGADLSFEDLFADWLTANCLGSVPAAQGSEQTEVETPLHRPIPAAVYDRYPVRVATSVQQYGADYIVLRGDDDLEVGFAGRAATDHLTAAPHSGRCAWWSNQADASLATLARPFDLSGVRQATLSYWVWYDIEPHYDYAAVEVSTDAGQSWHALPTPSGTDESSPRCNAPGWSYTGKSSGWIQESVDLSPYAGGKILLRFSYLTDEAITGKGLLLDDVSVRELGFEDGAEAGARGWSADGFRITDGRVPQGYLALLIRRGAENLVERLPLQEDRTGTWTVPLGQSQGAEHILVVGAMAPFTDQPAPYELVIGP